MQKWLDSEQKYQGSLLGQSARIPEDLFWWDCL